jgi:uncharacterized FAD-dependent dehydrogenase
MKRIVYVGAGVSTQYGVLHLLKCGYDPKKIIIIEKGDSIYDRKPSDVMSGAGGAGTYSDFKVLESWTQGGIFTPDYVELKTANRIAEIVKGYIHEYHPDPTKIMYTTPEEVPQWLLDSPFDLKQAPCFHLGTDYGRQQVQSIFEYFDKVGVKQYYNTEVTDIEFEHKKIWANTVKSKDYPEGIIHINYDKVILAGGKSGVDFLDSLIKKYNIKTKPRAAQLGLRYETDGKYFKELTKFAYDFKLYKKWNNISGRSFCVNSYAAFVAPEITYGKLSFNGHAYKDPLKYNGLTNFGIMLEIKDEIEFPFDFKQKLVSFFNKDGKSASYSPTNRKPSLTDEGKEMPCYSTTLEHLKEGYGKYADYILEFIEDLNKTFNINDDYIVYLPEIKYISNTLEFNNSDFSLVDYPDVHIQGDNGMSRGIWIASISGVYLSEHILQNQEFPDFIENFN